MINITSERLKARNIFICRYFIFMSSWNFVLSWIEHENVLKPRGPVKFNKKKVIAHCKFSHLKFVNRIYRKLLSKGASNWASWFRMISEIAWRAPSLWTSKWLGAQCFINAIYYLLFVVAVMTLTDKLVLGSQYLTNPISGLLETSD